MAYTKTEAAIDVALQRVSNALVKIRTTWSEGYMPSPAEMDSFYHAVGELVGAEGADYGDRSGATARALAVIREVAMRKCV
jgi:hypothetical protein